MLPAWTAHAAAAAPAIDGIRSEWSSRQARLSTVAIEWTETATYMAGTLPSKDGTVSDPPEHTTVEHRCVLKFKDDAKAHLRQEGLYWGANLAYRFVQRSRLSTFNGHTAKLLYEAEHYNAPSGDIWSKQEFADRDLEYVTPAIWACRPLAVPLGGIDLSEWRVVPESVVIGGHSCWPLQRRLASGAVETVWFADQPGFPMVRRELRNEAGVWHQCLWQYDADTAAGFLSGWECTDYDLQRGAIAAVRLCRVTSVFVNGEIADSEFDIVFPPNTVVNDPRGQRTIVIDTDGTQRVVARPALVGERQAAAAGGAPRLLVFIVATAVVGAIAGIVIWQAQRAPHNSSGPDEKS